MAWCGGVSDVRRILACPALAAAPASRRRCHPAHVLQSQQQQHDHSGLSLVRAGMSLPQISLSKSCQTACHHGQLPAQFVQSAMILYTVGIAPKIRPSASIAFVSIKRPHAEQQNSSIPNEMVKQPFLGILTSSRQGASHLLLYSKPALQRRSILAITNTDAVLSAYSPRVSIHGGH